MMELPRSCSEASEVRVLSLHGIGTNSEVRLPRFFWPQLEDFGPITFVLHAESLCRSCRLRLVSATAALAALMG